jgi:hypothetical protein
MRTHTTIPLPHSPSNEDNFVERTNNIREVFVGWKLKEEKTMV